MDCRFCAVRPAKFLRLPTVFGPADLCQVCAKRYERYLRRARHPTQTKTQQAALVRPPVVLFSPLDQTQESER
jgi:hypothetical protein